LQGKIALLTESIAKFKDMLYNSIKIFKTVSETPGECLDETENDNSVDNNIIVQDNCISDSEYNSEFSDYDDM